MIGKRTGRLGAGRSAARMPAFCTTRIHEWGSCSTASEQERQRISVAGPDGMQFEGGAACGAMHIGCQTSKRSHPSLSADGHGHKSPNPSVSHRPCCYHKGQTEKQTEFSSPSLAVTQRRQRCHDLHSFVSSFPSTMSPAVSMTALPIELIALTCRWLGTSDLHSMRLVSRDVSAIATPPTFETLTFSPSTITCLFAEFPHLLPHARSARLLYEGNTEVVGASSRFSSRARRVATRTDHALQRSSSRGSFRGHASAHCMFWTIASIEEQNSLARSHRPKLCYPLELTRSSFVSSSPDAPPTTWSLSRVAPSHSRFLKVISRAGCLPCG
jgi:hypothetical protein